VHNKWVIGACWVGVVLFVLSLVSFPFAIYYFGKKRPSDVASTDNSGPGQNRSRFRSRGTTPTRSRNVRSGHSNAARRS
jgi:hypothetical protein